MKLELSIEKTRVSDLTERFQLLSQRVRYKWHPRFGYIPRIEIPASKRADHRYMVKQMTKGANTLWSLFELLQKLNPVLRGWGNYYRFCTGASRQFAALDFHVGDCIWRWLMKKHKKLHRKRTRLARLPSLFAPLASHGVNAMSSSFSSHAARGTLPQRLDAHSCIHRCSRRAGCITKGARPVRRAGIRTRRQQCRTALMLDPTECQDL